MAIYNMCTQKKDKNGKAFYQPIGTIFEGEWEGKPTLSGYLNTNPDVKVYLFEKQPKNSTQAPQQTGQPQQTNNNIGFADEGF